MAIATREIEQIVRRVLADEWDDGRRDPGALGADPARENPARSVKSPGRSSVEHDVDLQAGDSIDSTGQIEEDGEEELEARGEDEDEELDLRVEDDEDEELEARGEDEDEELDLRVEDDEDEEIEARGVDEDEELDARGEDDEEIETRGADEDEDALGEAEEEERASALRAPQERPRAAKKSQADKVIALAKQQVGFREGKNNHTKFAAELIKAKIAQRWWQNQPWCQTFQAWAFVEAGLGKLAPMTPGCATAVAWFRARKRVNQYPAIGAQVFYGPGGGTHVGLVYKYDPTRIWTIEGNTNDKGSSEGIGVFLKSRSRKEAFGYGYPKYADGIVTADPRKKGENGFTFKQAASSGAKETASEPEAEERLLPWVSVTQVQWAATHSASAERAAKAGAAHPRDDVTLVQQALEKVMGTSPNDPDGIFGEGTERLFNRFRREKLKFTGAGASAKPGAKSLSALGRMSKLFGVRTGSMAEVNEKSAPTTPGKSSPRDVTFKRFTTPASPENISTWIREACGKAGATPSSAWVKGYKTIIKRESSGNPNACNVWDSNAKTPPGFRKVKDYGDGYLEGGGQIKLNGRPTHFQCSRGIVQCIPQTFANHHARGTSLNIYDPVASIAASMRYVLSRYEVAQDGSNLARKVQQADPTRPPKGY
jgi:hypothetical protein